jgi:hypothetical protein
MGARVDDEPSITRRWLQPISTRINSPMRHLVPTKGWMVHAVCGRLVNLRFAKSSKVRKCKVCERRFDRSTRPLPALR